MILKIFSQKNLAKKSAFLPQTKGNFAEKVIITSVFEKIAIFFAENWQKSQKIVIITSTPGPMEVGESEISKHADANCNGRTEARNKIRIRATR
jgi:hypothetical protein